MSDAEAAVAEKRRGKGAGRRDKGLEEALRRHVRTKGADYLKDANITSVGIGLKNGTGPVCLQFTVAEKGEFAIESLGSWRIPDTIEVEGRQVPTDVIERDYRPSFEVVEPETLGERRMRADPMRPGISAAHVEETAGTIGLIVFDRATGAPSILSNWHVLHGNRGAIGDPIVQPGPFDDNNLAGNFCGELLRSHLGAAGDCALARIRTRGYDRSVLELNVVPKRLARVALGDRVVKSGRTTGITYGIVRRVDVMARLNYGPPAGVRVIGCFEIGVDPERMREDGEISMGGDSGAAWLISRDGAATDLFAGLHFAGEVESSADEHALACYALSVQKKLDFVLEPPPEQLLPDDRIETAVPRAGYDPDFLGLRVPMPGLSLSLKRDAVNFGRAQTIPYTHFSVCLSARRRMARFVAWNVDGARRVILPRRAFKLDPRIEPAHQLGEELYAGNRLDRGHIARRADLCWGPVAEADQANRDSSFFTNIAPQHERFNQSSRRGLWGELENLALEQADALDIRISVFGGPIFADDDTRYRDALLPRSFWKLIAYRSSDGALRVSAFVLSQADLLHDLERLELDPFRIFQVTLSDLSTRTMLDFSALEPADVMAHPEMATSPAETEALRDPRLRIAEILSPADLRF
ncbi:Nuclease [Nitratireductor thuwali]|uniref:Nuclease n=1 Tax=Nitratireductor thuwali TaxID=2267699 RepID=A0ABY5MKX0_9HYPH|nr:Nuclease [Nitratireductor thuwali]